MLNNICPAKNTPEWKALENAVGKFEAMRDWMEHKGEVRTPEEVKAKLLARDEEYADIIAKKEAADLKQELKEPEKLFKEELKLVKKQLSFAERSSIINRVQAANQKLGTSFKIFFTPIGQANLFTWEIKDMRGSGGSAQTKISFHRDATLEEYSDENITEFPEMNVVSTDTARSLEIVSKLSQTLAEQLGVDYQVLTPNEAREITKDAQNPWNGESAFFIGDIVYFVGDNLNTEKVFHEFAHPIFRALSKSNNDTFNKLYEKLKGSSEGLTIIQQVKDLYPELSEDQDLFKEECLVRSLAADANNKFLKQQSSTGFEKFINDLLYSLKQLLRKMFGISVDVSKLDSTTTIDRLGEMLVAGKKFDIFTEQVSDEDVIAYVRDQQSYIDDVMKISTKDIQAMTNRGFDIASKHIEVVLKNKNYAEMVNILADEYNRGDLQEIRKNLSAYKTDLVDKTEKLGKDIDYTRNQTSALVNTLFRLDSMTKKILLHMEDISKQPDNIDNLHKAYYYDYLLKYWEQFVAEAKTNLDNNRVDSNSPLSQLLSSIETSIRRSKDLTNTMFTKGVKDVLSQELTPMSKSIDEKYNNIINNLKAKGADKHIIDRWTKEYESVKITPDKIEKLLRGELGDANAFNAFFEGYMYSSDPIVGGMALYVKNQMNDVLVKAQSSYNDFASKMEPLLKDINFSTSKAGELGKQVGFIDSVGTRDEEGNFVEKKVWSLLNPYKNYRFKQDETRHKIEQAQSKYSETHSDEDRLAVINLIAENKKHLREFFNQEYVTEFYDRQRLLEDDDIGKEAGYERDRIFEEMRLLSEPATSEMDVFAISDQIDSLWREYRQLHSLLDLNGAKKEGKDLEIAQRLREYRDASYKFYEFKERTGVFQNALNSFEQELVDKGYAKDGDDFKVLREEWLKKNTRIVIKPEFYERRNEIFDRIQQITSRLPDNERKKVDFTEAWQDILDAVAGFRDDDGQPIGTDMSEGRIEIVKKRQEEIIKAQEAFAGLSGLTPSESTTLSEMFAIIKAGDKLSKEDRDIFNSLLKKKDELGLNKYEKTELFSLFEELKELQRKEATDYYLDIVNNYLSKLDTNKLFIETGSRIITKDGSDMILKDFIVNDLMKQSPEFEAWFTKNHIRKSFYNKIDGVQEERWERLYIWNVVKPNDPKFMEKTDIMDSNGEFVEQIVGLPVMKYYARVVKPEYRNQRVVGETVDNRGNWLPKSMMQGATDERYRNEAYHDLQKNDPKMFEVLKALTEQHLKSQEGLSRKSKLYLDMPRFRKGSLETLQTTNVLGEKMSALTLYAKRVRDFFRGAKDDAESGYNAHDEFNLVRADMFDDEVSSIPIAGLYDLNVDEVSTDITETMMRYMLSAERQKKLVEISPVAQALKSVVNNPKNKAKQMDKVNQFNFVNRGVTTYLNKKGKYVRQTAVNNFIEREFEGKTQTGFAQETPWINNTANLLFKRASLGFFAVNIPSALKNTMGAKFQGMIEAAAGQYMNMQSYTKGEGWAFNTMGTISFEVYKQGPKSHNVQMVELFDPAQGRFEENFGESMSRGVAKDAANLTMLYNFRKWTELQASLHTFAGMMYFQKVKQDGKEINYMDAWETIDGKIQLKKGIDPTWGVTYDADGNMLVGAEFKRMKNQIQQVMNNLNGAYSKFDQPEAQRYIAFKFISYLRRYFTTMAVNRWGFSGSIAHPMARLNPGLGTTTEGWYISTLKLMVRTVRSGGKYLSYMTPEEKRGFIKVVTEVGSLIAINALMAPLFGWDPDDEEKYAKLREKSGPLPFPFVSANEPEFKLGGYLENHALMLMMNIRSENEQFAPFPNMGNYKQMLDVKSVAFGPTLDAYSQVFDDLVNIYQEKDVAYYKRRVGPYEWQQQESAKVWAHMFKTVGLTGNTLDPATAIKNFQSVQARAK